MAARLVQLNFSIKSDLNLKFAGEEDRWTFQMYHISRIPFEVEENDQYLTLFSENPANDFLILVEEILELFECPNIHRVCISTCSSRRTVKSFVPWMNKTNLEIQNIFLAFIDDELFKFILTSYEKPFKGLETQGGGCLNTPQKLQFDYLNAEWAGQWLTLEQLFALDCREINMGYISISIEEINLFLKSWKEGKTNNRLEQISIRFDYGKTADWNVILKGLEPKVSDLMTTKRKYVKTIGSTKGTYWLHGGLDIQRDDGTIATIFHLCFVSSEENTEIPQVTIDYFEKYRDKDWNSGEVEIEDGEAEEEARRMGLLMPKRRFEMVVFE
uniref:FBA_2 domain-containing protein n=1 Tax=Caenorhabditis tropicalis TaxID=1561998 RepID=A0A1I7UZS5_9PELO